MYLQLIQISHFFLSCNYYYLLFFCDFFDNSIFRPRLFHVLGVIFVLFLSFLWGYILKGARDSSLTNTPHHRTVTHEDVA